jgi:hypothetical protein
MDSPAAYMKLVYLLGPELPPMPDESALTFEDYRDLTMDHIQRSESAVFQLEIYKRA